MEAVGAGLGTHLRVIKLAGMSAEFMGLSARMEDTVTRKMKKKCSGFFVAAVFFSRGGGDSLTAKIEDELNLILLFSRFFQRSRSC